MILRRAIAHEPLHARKKHAAVLPRRTAERTHLDSLPKALAGSTAHGKCADAVLAIQKELAGIHGAAMARAQLGRAKDKARVIASLCARRVFAGHEMIVRRLSIGRIRDKRSIPRIRRADAQHGPRPRHHQNHANTGSENKGRRNDRQTLERRTGHICSPPRMPNTPVLPAHRRAKGEKTRRVSLQAKAPGQTMQQGQSKSLRRTTHEHVPQKDTSVQ